MVDFLYGVNWRRFIEEKWVRMAKSAIFRQNPRVVPVPKVGTGTHCTEVKW